MTIRSITVGIVLVLLGTSTVAAQQSRRVPGYLGIRFEETVRRGDVNSDRIVVREVSKDSPADKAGLKVEDEIVRINGLAATDGKFSALARTLVAGDTVRLRIKREGKERDITVVAGERPPAFGMFHEITINGDSVRRLMLRYLDTARVRIDSLKLPSIYISRGDSAGWRLMPYSVAPLDSMLLKRDSTFIWRFRGGANGPPLIFPPGERFEFEGELAPGMIFRSMDLGSRAVGGAEFTEMDPALADYFGTQNGLLTLRVLAETPAERAGLQPGDVVIKARDRTVRSVAELRSIIAANPDGVKLEVRRKGQNRTIELKTRGR